MLSCFLFLIVGYEIVVIEEGVFGAIVFDKFIVIMKINMAVTVDITGSYGGTRGEFDKIDVVS